MGPDEPDSENSRTLCFALRSRDLRLLPVPTLERPPPEGVQQDTSEEDRLSGLRPL